jgi:hypothetical protein
MPYVFAAALVLVLGILLILVPRARSSDGSDGSARPPPPAVHAMCYKPRPTSTTTDFVCPKDGARTQYPVNGRLAARLRELPRLQASARQLAAPAVAARATIVLDLSEFCRTCTPKPPAMPAAVLKVKLPAGKQTRTRGITPEDLVLLAEFFAGSDEHQRDDGKTVPLERSLPRIRKLLGMPGATIAKRAK